VDSIRINSEGFVFIDDVKIGRYNKKTNQFAFLDKDKRRCSKRGSKTVEISPEKLLEACKQVDIQG